MLTISNTQAWLVSAELSFARQDQGSKNMDFSTIPLMVILDRYRIFITVMSQ